MIFKIDVRVCVCLCVCVCVCVCAPRKRRAVSARWGKHSAKAKRSIGSLAMGNLQRKQRTNSSGWRQEQTMILFTYPDIAGKINSGNSL